MRCTFISAVPLVLLINLSIFSCKGDNPTTASNDLVLRSLVGTWNATKYEYRHAEDYSQHVDLIAAFGTVTLMINSASKYNLNLGGSGGLNDCGTIIVEEDTLAFNADAALEITIHYDYELSGDTLTLITHNAEIEWDFDSDGVDDPVVLTMVLKKGSSDLTQPWNCEN